MIGLGAFRLAWRLQRAEIAFVAVACLALAGVAILIANDMRSILALCGTPVATKACDVTYAFQDTHGEAVRTIQMVASFMPFVAGLMLGVPIVAHEVEQRTALMTWPIARSRFRWLSWRFLPVGAMALVLICVLAFAADQLARAYFPHDDIGFVEYGARGLPMVMRAAFMLIAGLALGAIVGRTLPALLLGIGVAVLLSVGLQMALDRWVPSTELGDAELLDLGMGRLATGVQYRLADGRMVSADEGEALVEEAVAEAVEKTGRPDPDPASTPRMILYGVPADRYPEVVTRESVALALASMGVAAIGILAVSRRRLN